MASQQQQVAALLQSLLGKGLESQDALPTLKALVEAKIFSLDDLTPDNMPSKVSKKIQAKILPKKKRASSKQTGGGSPNKKRTVSNAWIPMSANAPPPAYWACVNQPPGPQLAWTPYPLVRTIWPKRSTCALNHNTSSQHPKLRRRLQSKPLNRSSLHQSPLKTSLGCVLRLLSAPSTFLIWVWSWQKVTTCWIPQRNFFLSGGWRWWCSHCCLFHHCFGLFKIIIMLFLDQFQLTPPNQRIRIQWTRILHRDVQQLKCTLECLT